MRDQYIDAVRDWPTPQNAKAVQRFLSFANYHRNVIARFSETVAPLYAVTDKTSFLWGEEQQQSLEALVERLTSPVLAIPTTEGKFGLDTDASDLAISGEFSQIQDGQERTIAYTSTVLSTEKRRYCTARKELLSVIKFTRQFRHYLTVRTDHHSLTWLFHFRHSDGQIARWLEELTQYNMKLEPRPRK